MLLVVYFPPRRLDTMKKLPNWGKINEAFDGLRAAVKGQKFVTLA